MSSVQLQQGTNRRCRLPGYAVLVAALFLVGFALHGVVLEWGVRKALETLASHFGFDATVGAIHARIGSPVAIQHLEIRTLSPGVSQTALTLRGIEIRWNWLPSMLGRNGRVIKSLSVQGGRINLDFRRGLLPSRKVSMRRSTQETHEREAHAVLRWLPLRMVLEDLTLEGIGEAKRFLIHGIRADFDEAALGEFRAEGMEVQFGNTLQAFASQHAVTAWKDGTAYLSNMSLRVGMAIENFSLQLARPGGVGFDIQATLFGGSLRGGAVFGEWRGEPGMDAVFWGADVDLGELSKFLGMQASGLLSEGRVTFRGNPRRPLDGEASLRISAEDFRLGNRGWKSLEVGASLINRRLSLGEFRLHQKGNLVSLHGEAALSGDWRDTTKAPFLLNLSAEIQDMTSLGALLGPPFDELGGRMTATAMVSGHSNKIDGFASIEASGMKLRGRTIEAARIGASFSAGEVQINSLEVWSGKDFLAGEGAISLRAPHAYSGQIRTKIRDMAAYAWLPGFPLPVSKGHLEAAWQGDGTWNAHSGAFQASGKGLVSAWSPQGLTGRASGTYSPFNFYFGEIVLERGRMALNTRMTLAESGIRVDDLIIRQAGKMAASGEMFLPLDVFRLLRGEGPYKSLLPGKPLHLRFQTLESLPLEALMGLMGRTPIWEGRLAGRMTASGSTAHPELDAAFSVRNLKSPGREIPESDFRLAGGIGQDVLRVSGEWAAQGYQTANFSLQVPLPPPSGSRSSFLDPRGPLSGSFEAPRTSLAFLHFLLPAIRKAAGTLSGRLELAGHVSHPEIHGQLTVHEGRLALNTPLPELEALSATLNFGGQSARVESCKGRAGAGTFALAGSIGFVDPSAMDVNLRIEGSGLTLVSTPTVFASADASLEAHGHGAEGTVRGTFQLTEAKLLKPLEVVPSIRGVPAPPPFQAPVPKGITVTPWNAWSWNASLTNPAPLLAQGEPTAGKVSAELRLTGTLGAPVLTGTLHLDGAQAFFPAAELTIPQGSISFSEAAPWMPVLDITGDAVVGSRKKYQVRLLARGPLSQGELTLHSIPPLAPEQIARLLTVGDARGEPTPPLSGNLTRQPSLFTIPVPPYFGKLTDSPSRVYLTNKIVPDPESHVEDGVSFRIRFRDTAR